MSDIAIFTISSGNFFPQAKTFLDSLYSHHQEIDLYYFLADEISSVITENSTNFNVICANQLKIEQFDQFSFKYSIVELNTAIKPFCFEYLIDKQQYKKILFFDPDIFVFNKLDLLFNLLNDHSILLTPHIANKDFAINHFVNLEFTFLRYGIFNLGFLAIKVDDESLGMIKWLKQRCRDNCYILKNEATYVDQKWANFIPSLFGNVHVIRHLGCNMAYWNIHEREISGYFKVNNQFELLFFHFSSFDTANNQLITLNQGINTSLKERKDLVPIFDIYRKVLLENLKLKNEIPEYKYLKYNNGEIIIEHQRTIYQYVNDLFTKPYEATHGTYYQFLKKRNRVSKISKKSADFSVEMWIGAKKDYWYVKLFYQLFYLLHKILGSVKYYSLVNQAKNYLAYLSSNAFILNSKKTKTK